jgi:hypothetical protein
VQAAPQLTNESIRLAAEDLLLNDGSTPSEAPASPIHEVGLLLFIDA